MAEPKNRQGEISQSDDLRVIYKDRPTMLRRALLSYWPTKLQWELTQNGTTIQMNLSGIGAAIMFLRCMFVFADDNTQFGGDGTRLMQLAWRTEPLSDQTRPEEIEALLQELQIPIRQGKSPTFLYVLHHSTLADFWGAASMRLERRQRLYRTANGEPHMMNGTLDKRQPYDADMLKLKMGTSIAARVRTYFDKVGRIRDSSNRTAKRLCNFPPFIRIHCLPREDASPPELKSFSDFRSFTIRQEPVDEVGLEEKEQLYVLIAYVQLPQSALTTPVTIRLWNEEGSAISPTNGLPYSQLDRLYGTTALGQPYDECILLYCRSKPAIYEELPGAPRVAEFLGEFVTPKRLVDIESQAAQVPNIGFHGMSRDHLSVTAAPSSLREEQKLRQADSTGKDTRMTYRHQRRDGSKRPYHEVERDDGGEGDRIPSKSKANPTREKKRHKGYPKPHESTDDSHGLDRLVSEPGLKRHQPLESQETLYNTSQALHHGRRGNNLGPERGGIDHQRHGRDHGGQSHKSGRRHGGQGRGRGQSSEGRRDGPENRR